MFKSSGAQASKRTCWPHGNSTLRCVGSCREDTRCGRDVPVPPARCHHCFPTRSERSGWRGARPAGVCRPGHGRQGRWLQNSTGHGGSVSAGRSRGEKGERFQRGERRSPSLGRHLPMQVWGGMQPGGRVFTPELGARGPVGWGARVSFSRIEVVYERYAQRAACHPSAPCKSDRAMTLSGDSAVEGFPSAQPRPLPTCCLSPQHGLAFF